MKQSPGSSKEPDPYFVESINSPMQKNGSRKGFSMDQDFGNQPKYNELFSEKDFDDQSIKNKFSKKKKDPKSTSFRNNNENGNEGPNMHRLESDNILNNKMTNLISNISDITGDVESKSIYLKGI